MAVSLSPGQIRPVLRSANAKIPADHSLKIESQDGEELAFDPVIKDRT